MTHSRRSTPAAAALATGVLAALTLGACGPSPSSSGGTSAPQVSSSQVSGTPEEQLALDAYQSAYRERVRSVNQGRVTEGLQRVADGAYLSASKDFLSTLKGSRIEQMGTLKAVPSGTSQDNEVHLLGCQDDHDMVVIKNGRRVANPPSAKVRYVQDVTVKRENGSWKVVEVRSEPVESFRGTRCAGL